MKKKLLTCLVALLTVSFSAFAQESDIAGTYTGTLNVSLTDTDMENTNIFLEKGEGETYNLSVKDFEFMGEVIGDLVVTGISKSEKAGIIVLSKEEASNGPTVDLNGVSLKTLISFNAATIADGELELDLTVNGEGMEKPITDVTFKGSKPTTGLSTTDAEPMNIAVYGGTLTITQADNAEYTIYSASGSGVQAGVIENSNINISNLPTGIYILSVNGNAIKFAK